MRVGGCRYSSPTELLQLLAQSICNSVHPQLPLHPFFQFPALPGLVFRTSARLALLLRLEIISCRWCKAQLCPRLQGRLQQQSLAQSLLSYAIESCCTVVPKHKKLDLLLWKAGDNSCDPVVQGHTQTQGSASLRCNSLIFITEPLTMNHLAPQWL